LDWFQWIAGQRERRTGVGHWFEVPPHDISEVSRFVAQWPEVSRQIGLEADPTKHRLFDPGRASYQSVSEGVSLGGPFFRDLLDAHTSADHGVYADDGDIIAGNAAAVASRSGAVRSRYLLPDAEQKRWRGPEHIQGRFGHRPDRVIDVVTAFGPRDNETIMFVEALPAGGPSSSSAAMPQTVVQTPDPPKPAPYVAEAVDPFVAAHPWVGDVPARKLGAPHSPLR
jgi:hypothetical protein